MEKDLDLGLFDRIWTSDVLPYLEEQLFGREVDVAKTFSLKALESGGGPEAEAGEDAEGSGPSDESEWRGAAHGCRQRQLIRSQTSYSSSTGPRRTPFR